MSDRTIKIILWIIALGAAWDLGRSYVLINSLLLFAVGGVVPGTNTTLTPDQSLLFSGVFLAIALLLIFSTNMRRALRRVFGYKTIDVEAVTVIEVPVNKTAKKARKNAAKPVVAYRKPKQPSFLVVTMRSLVGKIVRITGLASSAIKRHFPVFAAACTRSWRQFAYWIQILKAYGATVAKRTQRTARTLFVNMSIFIVLQTVRFWRWANPYIRKTDAWLGRQYTSGLIKVRANDTVKALMRLSHETNKVVMGWREDARNALSRVLEK